MLCKRIKIKQKYNSTTNQSNQIAKKCRKETKRLEHIVRNSTKEKIIVKN